MQHQRRVSSSSSSAVILLALVAQLGSFAEANSAFNVGFLSGLDSNGAGHQGGFLSSSFGNTMDLAGGIPNLLNNAVQQVTKPLDGVVGNLLKPVGSALSSVSSLTGGITGQIGAGLNFASGDTPAAAGLASPLAARAAGAGAAAAAAAAGAELGAAPSVGQGSTVGTLSGLQLPTGLVGGLATGLAAATGLNSVTNAATAASQPLIDLSGAATAAARSARVAQSAGAVSAASRTAGAMSALNSAANVGAAAMSAGNNLVNNAALSTAEAMGAAGTSRAINTAAAASLAARNSMAATSGALANSMGALNGMSAAAHYAAGGNLQHMHQRREALASGARALGGSMAAAEQLGAAGASEAAAAAVGSASAAAGLEAAAGLGSGAAALGYAHPLGAAGLAQEAALGAGMAANGMGMNGLRSAEAAAAATGGALAAGAAMNSLASREMALGGAYGHLPAGAYAMQAAAAAASGQEALANQADAATAAMGSMAAASNKLAAATTAAALRQPLVDGVAHQSGMALNRIVARDAIDSMGRSLGAGRALELAAEPLAAAGNGAQLAPLSGAISAETALTEPVVEGALSPVRQNLAAEAHANAQAEAAIAGGDMVAHGLENSQSASLASNAYRQAKLASARDRVNIAGTIQNSARISDAAIATHDAATKAEDSLLGSELAVDSAATVLDSDAAYIPPVTSSMLRSLPYGRLGLRNILPRPLSYPSVLLPDVWLNGLPVNYKNVPFRMMPFAIGAEGAVAAANMAGVYGINRPVGAADTALAAAAAAATGAPGLFLEGQPIISNNGIYLNGLVVDPKYAYLRNGQVAPGTSNMMPILANGQLEAQDEVAMANILTAQQQLGPGMLSTYNGFGRLNTVPMLTGSVSDANLAPTTTVGTTYPIGSALVVEPRDSYFQDYIDNASSRQNFDERQQ